MKISDLVKETVWLLLNQQMISYRWLRREFDLDDSYLEDLRHELIQVRGWATDQDGEFLVWAGTAGITTSQSSPRALAPIKALTPVHKINPAVQSSVHPPTESQKTRGLAEVAPLTAEPTTPATPASDAERRPLTVMFCDLADSTALSTKLDPEDLQDVIRAYQESCTTLIKDYEGYVAKYMGDGILVYFGYPISLERNAERAVRTAIAIVEAMTDLNHTLGREKEVEIAVRIGVATGVVVVGEVVGEGLAQERTVIGEAPNVAARLQGIARRNGIVIGSLTKELAGDAFDYEDLGPQELKGITGTIPAWFVTGLKADAGVEADTAEIMIDVEVPQLVGRDEETGLLRRAWHSTKEERRGQVVTLGGEAGIGKSVLVDGLSAEVRSEGLPRVTFRCSPYHTNSALYPVIEHFKRLAAWQPEDSVDDRLAKLETMLERYGQPLAETVPLFTALLSLPLPEDRFPPLDLTPQQRKQQTQDTIIAMTLEDAERQCLLQIWEDLHWADPSTLELLGLLIEQAPTAALLIVLTARVDFVPPWPARSHITPITLSRLERQHTEALIARTADMKPLPAEVVDHIVGKTDGVPLYVEELTKTILTSNVLRDAGERFELTGPLSSLSIPETLQGSLMARLDRLPQVREIAQLGAVLGREFAYEMISGLSTISESGLQDGLGQLVDAELLYQRGRPPRAKYIFKHALIQDAAYQSLLKRTRQQFHQRVAELLEERFQETVDAQPELVAYHFGEAGDVERAVHYWHKAGEQARAKSAHLEAISYLERGIEMLDELADDETRVRQELAMQVSLGHANIVVNGHAALGAERAYARALVLCEELGDVPELAPTLIGLWRFHVVARPLDETEDIARRLLRLEEGTEVTEIQVAGHYAMGFTSLCMGKLGDARINLEEGIALYLASQRSAEVYHLGGEAGVICRAYLAQTEWLLGFPERAQRNIQESVALAEELDDPFTLARALCFTGAIISEVCGRDTDTFVERGLDLATQKGFSFWADHGRVHQMNANFKNHLSDSALDELRHSVDARHKTGAHSTTPYYRTLLARACQQAGRIDEGLRVLEEAKEGVEARGERWWESEVQRLTGELLLSQSIENAADAERCFVQAIDISRNQEAKSLELRAAMSLARLWQRQGKGREARPLLGDCYGWFTEGFETADLKEAKALIDDLTVNRVA